MKTLVIAEKPSVAKDIAKVLKVSARNDVFENDKYVISSAIGHLIALSDPDDYDASLKRWTLKNLPIIPESFHLKVSDDRGAKEQFSKLKKLLARSDIDVVVNACDAGREGELIFTYIYEVAKCNKKVRRLWLTSMTADAIRDGFSHLRTGEEMQDLCAAAKCRAESDWLIGMNGTRAVTVRTKMGGNGASASVGRVQTPTLSLIVQRELDIRNFIPQKYWRIVAEFGVKSGTYEGVYQKPNFKKADKETETADKIDRIWEEVEAKRIYEICKKTKIGAVSEEKKRTTEICQKLYDLTTLQRDANKRFGFSATKTLQIAQALYEKHKATTYPRTDARALPEDYINVCKKTMSIMEASVVGKSASKVLKNGWIHPNKRIFNNNEISDHFAIVPTDQIPKSLAPDEEKIYNLVLKRFVAIFFPVAEYDVTTRKTDVEGHIFKTEGKVLVVPGWREVYGQEEVNSDDILTPISDEDGAPPKANVKEVQLQKEETKPSPRYTDATLLAAMESAGKLVEDEELANAMKDRGLGTPATRAGIIDNLIKSKYLERAGRELIPTIKAEQLLAFLKVCNVECLTSPTMTGDWEYRLNQVADGDLNRSEFMKGIADLTKSIVEKIGEAGGDEQWEASKIISPTDKKPMMENYRIFRSQDMVEIKGRSYPALSLSKNIGGRNFTNDEIAVLIEKNEIGPFDDFKSRFGKAFTASVRLAKNENGLIRPEFIFAERPEDEAMSNFDYSTAKIVGVCPVSKLNVYETPVAYRVKPTEIPKNLKGKPFFIGKTLLGKELSVEQIEKLFKDGKTDLIQGFVSNRTKRAFDAFLIMSKNGWRFEFPPRVKAEKSAKKAPAKRKLIKKKATDEESVEN